MLKEETFIRKQNEIITQDREYERKFRDEQARTIVEARNQQYLLGMTDSHTDMLDPTGRASRVDPSTVATIPDKSFGLAKSNRYTTRQMQKVTQKIREKLRTSEDDFGEYARLLTGLQAEVAAFESQPTSGSGHHVHEPPPRANNAVSSHLQADEASKPGAEPLTMTINFGPDETELLTGAYSAMDADVDDDDIRPQRHLSKFEQTMHEK